jgi:hypothetical protein
MTYDNSLVEDVNRYVEAFESTRDYLESGGDITYAFLNLAKLDLELASKYVKDPYCRKQVLGEYRALEKALSFAMMAYEWRMGIGGWRYKIRLIAKAILEIAKLTIVHLSRF